jgi:8-oxo-dGTP pyrophosphatase MutT (NUDIX family)
MLGRVEQVEVLDERGAVVDIVGRDVMRAENLRHRTVYIAVLDGRRLLVHQRADWKDVWPSRWDVAFGGVCGVGERWTDAAQRELAEEAGITVADDELLDMGDGWYDSAVVRVVGRVFAVQHGGPFSHPDGEVQRTEWVTLADLEPWLAAHDVCDDSLEVVVPRLLD